MNRALLVPLLKLGASALALILLLLLWRLHSTDGFGAVAAVTSIVVAGPVTLLAGIDFARALRRTSVSSTIKRISLGPQFLLGGLACLCGVLVTPLVLLGPQQGIPLKAFGCFVGVSLFLYGISLLRDSQ
ncbi:MAG TPA: hypothetical protein VMG33_07090 [Steroidobacteraceae bacterium]|nr:hypothetical protein [Steroidobacteraceae bacterium]